MRRLLKFKKTHKILGFTLIELIMIVVLLGVMAVLALPKFFDLGNQAAQKQFLAVKGAYTTAVQTIHLKWRVLNKPPSITTNGITIVMQATNGWPLRTSNNKHIPLPPADYSGAPQPVQLWYALLQNPPKIKGVGTTVPDGWHALNWSANKATYSLFRNNVKLYAFTYNRVTGAVVQSFP
jgi:type II secretory pathway pseudopilin PulG